MLTKHTPPGIRAPFSRYVHGVEAPGTARWLHVSGQVGVDAEGNTAEGPAAQMDLCWRNIFAVLESAGMAPDNIVKVTAYLTRQEDTGLYREVRDRLLDGVETASTLVIVSGLAHPDWLVEIEVVAAG